MSEAVFVMKLISRVASAAFLTFAGPQVLLADQHIMLDQEAPEVRNIDLGEPGHSHGDLMLFNAVFTAEDGSSGVITGRVTTVDRQDNAEEQLFKRQSEIVLDFENGDTLVVLGRSTYRINGAALDPHGKHVRAIIGGTGRFVGARGQLTTTGKENGEYIHDVHLLD